MSAIRALERMLEAGVPLETAIELARGFEADMADYARAIMATIAKDESAERRREKDRERKAEVRRSLRMSADNADKEASPPSPKPPTTSQVNPTPFTPLKGGVSPTLSEPPLAEQIWALQPNRGGKRRSTRPDVQRAAEAAVRRGAKPDELLAACRTYYRLPDSRKDGGEYAMGAARLLQADRWRDFLPSPDPPAQPPSAAEVARRLQHYRDTGEWKPHWGDRPRSAA